MSFCGDFEILDGQDVFPLWSSSITIEGRFDEMAITPQLKLLVPVGLAAWGRDTGYSPVK